MDDQRAHSDRLHLSAKLAKEKLDQRRNLKLSIDLIECTFQPQTNQTYAQRDILSARVIQKSSEESVGRFGSEHSCSQRLFESVSHFNLKPRNDKSAEQIDFERNSEKCTFTPQMRDSAKKKNFKDWTISQF